jgi:hypothetical protein
VGFGDVDLNFKAVEAGYYNVYFGDLSGVHHESLTRGVTAEEVEYLQLNRLHHETIEEERLMFRDKGYFGQIAAASLKIQLPELFCVPSQTIKPLRYKVVDRLNSWAKKLMPNFLHFAGKRVLSQFTR